MSEKMRRVLVFGSYVPDAEVDPQDDATYEAAYPWSRYTLLRKALEYPNNTKGDKEHRKRLKELARRFRKLAEWHESDIRVLQNGVEKTERRKDWRLLPAGGEVLMMQSELDLLRTCWKLFTSEAGMDVEFSSDVDDFLENVPERAIVEAVAEPMVEPSP